MNSKTKAILVLSSLFIVLLMVSNLISSKTIALCGFVFPAGVLAYSLTFTISDTITELMGRKATYFIIRLALFLILLQFFFVYIAVHAPGSPFWVNQAAYAAILLNKFRIFVGSAIAFLISQHVNAWLFDLMKNKWGDKKLWLRKNTSTILSQMIDTSIFICIAFAGRTLPLFDLLLGQFICKTIISLLDTPLIYLGVGILKRKNSHTMPSEETA